MTDRFPNCLAFVLKAEGGFNDDPADPGGATNKGVTQRVYDAYRTKNGLPTQSVELIEDGEVSDIYKSEYWEPTSCDQLPAGVDLCVFDFAVNAGDTRSEETLQQALEVTVDGQIGPQTITAAQAADPLALANHMLDLRKAFYQALVVRKPADAKFLNGWLNRVAALRATL
jgi:lysozyme family protein